MAEPGGAISVVPANEASWQDLQTTFGTQGAASWCQCQRYKLRPRAAFAKFPVEERACRLRHETACGHPDRRPHERSRRDLDGQPVGWCGRAPSRLRRPRPKRPRAVGGREEDKADDGIRAVTCVFTRVGFPK